MNLTAVAILSLIFSVVLGILLASKGSLDSERSKIL